MKGGNFGGQSLYCSGGEYFGKAWKQGGYNGSCVMPLTGDFNC